MAESDVKLVTWDWLEPSHSFRFQRKSIGPGLEILRPLDELISCVEEQKIKFEFH